MVNQINADSGIRRWSQTFRDLVFVAFEIKYSESMREPLPELKPRHAELSDASGLYVDPAAEIGRAHV